MESLNQSTHINSDILLNLDKSQMSKQKSLIRVLHVDDDQATLHISKSILKDFGEFEIEQALDVKEAIKKLENQSYDAIICDFEMPEVDSLRFLRDLRESLNEIPFILFTRKGKRAEANQHLLEQKFQRLFESTPDSIIIYDSKGFVESVNQAAVSMLGYKTARQMIGLFGPEICADPRDIKVLIEQVVKTGSVKDFEAKLKKVNGEIFDVMVTLTVQKDFQGRVLRYESIIRDISESKRAQEELRQRTEQLEVTKKELEANAVLLGKYASQMEKLAEERAKKLKNSERLATIGATAAMVGHDLRNPLTGIKNATYILRTKGSSISQVQAKEMLETIDRCVEHSNKIVNDLLDYSRQIHLELQDISPRQILADSLAMTCVPETIDVINNLPDYPRIEVDPDKIKRVFINLIKNAIDAMSNVGKLTIEATQEKACIQICLTDTGAGIADDILPKLFSPLFTTKAQGMGFGLAICKRIVEAHGGSISVKTAIGEGTTFTISLPLKNPFIFYYKSIEQQITGDF